LFPSWMEVGRVESSFPGILDHRFWLLFGLFPSWIWKMDDLNQSFRKALTSKPTSIRLFPKLDGKWTIWIFSLDFGLVCVSACGKTNIHSEPRLKRGWASTLRQLWALRRKFAARYNPNCVLYKI
jgi:hypothetical protein